MATALARAMKLIAELRKVDPEMPMQVAAVFLAVAAKPGITQTEAAEAIGVSKSAISRHFVRLSTVAQRGEPQLGLIEMYEPHHDRRFKAADLTSQGKRVAGAIESIMRGEVYTP